MAQVMISGNQYDSYADVAYADNYLAADVLRAEPWAALDDDPDKGRALVTATRLLQRLSWIDGVPDVANPPDVVMQATSLLSADIAATPSTGDSGSTGSNVKSVGAGSARVEFFAPVAGTPLPSAAFDLLRGLLGPGSSLDDPSLDATAYGSEWWRRSHFDPTNYDLYGGYSEERLF